MGQVKGTDSENRETTNQPGLATNNKSERRQNLVGQDQVDSGISPERASWIKIICTHCNKAMSVAASMKNRRVRCTHCSGRFDVIDAVRDEQPAADSKTTKAGAKRHSQESRRPTSRKRSSRQSNNKNLVPIMTGLLIGLLVTLGAALYTTGKLDPWLNKTANSRTADSNGDQQEGGLVESDSGSGASVNGNSVNDRTEPGPEQMAGEPEEPTQPKTPFDLKFNFGSPESILGYQLEANIIHPQFPERVIKGQVYCRTVATDSKVRIKNRRGRETTKRRPATEFATGMGYPGKRIVVSSAVVQGASSMWVVVGQERFSAQLIGTYEKDGFAVLEYSGPEFPKPIVARTSEIFNDANVVRINPSGNVEILESRRCQGLGGRWGHVIDKLDPRFKNGFVVQHWGSIAGLYFNDPETSGIVDIQRVVKQLPESETAFEFQPPTEKMSLKSLPDAMQKNLVLVEVERETSKSPNHTVEFVVELPNEEVSELDPLVWQVGRKFQRAVYSSSGKRDGTVKASSLPFFFGFTQELPMFPLQPGRFDWSEQHLLEFQKSGYVVNRESHDQWKTYHSRKGRQTDEYEITTYDESSGIATIIRKFTTADEIKARSSGTPRYLPVKLEGQQTIQFDCEKGIVLQVEMTGQLQFTNGDQKVPVEVNLSLTKLNDEKANTEFDATVPPIHWMAPTQKLADFDVDVLIGQLTSEKRNLRFEALQTLCQIAPEANAGISAALARDYPRNFAGDRQFRWHARKVARNWLLPEDLPRVADSFSRSERADGNFPVVIELLNLHPPMPESKWPVVQKLMSLAPDRKDIVRLRSRQYPQLNSSAE